MIIFLLFLRFIKIPTFFIQFKFKIGLLTDGRRVNGNKDIVYKVRKQ